MNPVESLITNTTANEGIEEDPVVPGPFATCEEVSRCQFSSWYPKFSNLEERKRKNVTIKSMILRELPSDFQEYLLSDGVILPVGAEKLSSCVDGNGEWSSEDEDEDEDDDDDADDESAEDAQDSSSPQYYHFPHLNQELQAAIASLEGYVIPKLNWSAPKDATWVNGGSLKCHTPGDIYLLLKSSDFCLHDVLRKTWEECEDYHQSKRRPCLELVLRKWCNLHPSMEFRCFVRQHEMLAISQRNHTQHYPHLQHDRPRIEARLVKFFEETIRNSFADGEVTNYVFDVYLDKKNRVWLLDFNVWAQSTDSLLFDWMELATLDVEDDPDFRIVDTANQVRQDPLASYRAPIDTVNLASMTGGDAKTFEDFMKECQRPAELDAGEEDEGLQNLENID